MIRFLGLSTSILFLLYNTSFSQSDSIQWNMLVKPHNNFEIIYDDYEGGFWVGLNDLAQIFVDTIAAIEPNKLDILPAPLEGMGKFIASIRFPEIARRAGIEGYSVVRVTVDTSGNTKDIEVLLSNPATFTYTVSGVLGETKFIPAVKDGKVVEAQIAIAFSFVLYKKRSVKIDTIIVDKSACLGKCPSYTITLTRSGEATYNGRYFVDKIGKWKSVINKYEFEGLTSLILKSNLFGMKDTYSTNATDFPWVTITLITDKITKKVTTDYYLPVWEIARLVDLITEDMEWEEIDE